MLARKGASLRARTPHPWIIPVWNKQGRGPDYGHGARGGILAIGDSCGLAALCSAGSESALPAWGPAQGSSPVDQRLEGVLRIPLAVTLPAARPSGAPKAGEDGVTDASVFPRGIPEREVIFRGTVVRTLNPGNSQARQSFGHGERCDRLACDHPGRSSHGLPPRPRDVR